MKRHVLVIDDDPNILELIGDILTLHGYEIKKAKNGFEALKKIDRDRYDLIISDIDMPVMGGMEFYKELVNKFSSMKDRIIFMTGNMDVKTKIFIREVGVKGLSKPFGLTDLLKAADDVMGSMHVPQSA